MPDTTAATGTGMSFGLLVAYAAWAVTLTLASYGAYAIVGFAGYMTGYMD